MWLTYWDADGVQSTKLELDILFQHGVGFCLLNVMYIKTDQVLRIATFCHLIDHLAKAENTAFMGS
jgi:hypothetical protein